LGHFFGALQIAGFSDVDAFKKRVDQWIRTMRATPPAPGESAVLIPGDPERDAESHRSVHGIPLLPTVAADLEIAADLAGVQFPDPIPQ
jgi:L-2-hydroxycarboxylate dehydrogenase (NAD+)